MNARQKAKLYKRQVEQYSIEPKIVYLDRTQLKHRSIHVQIPVSFESKFNKDDIKKEVKNRVRNELDDIIYNNIIETEDSYYKEFYNYEFDIWTIN